MRVDSSMWTGRGPKWTGRPLFDPAMLRAAHVIWYFDGERLRAAGQQPKDA